MVLLIIFPINRSKHEDPPCLHVIILEILELYPLLFPLFPVSQTLYIIWSYKQQIEFTEGKVYKVSGNFDQGVMCLCCAGLSHWDTCHALVQSHANSWHVADVMTVFLDV